jgi:hypothetical protein
MEKFKNIPGYEGLYGINTNGVVISYHGKKSRILKQSLQTGYLSVLLCNNSKPKRFRVHQLMAITFLNHKPNGNTIVVDHIDNNKKNNVLSNLRLVTHRTNTSKRLKKYSSKYPGVYFHKQVKKWRAQIQINHKSINLGLFHSEEKAFDAYLQKLKTL